MLYYTIGKQIVLKQKETDWGDNLIGQMEKGLKQAFPEMSGFSRRNLIYMRKFYQFIGENEKVPQLVAQIPWGHIRLILDKIRDLDEAIFYIQETIANTWSRAMLDHQIALKLYQRQGKLKSNFEEVIDSKEIELIKDSFKENYVLDFLDLGKKASEKDLEKALAKNVTDFMLEMGKGFAFVGRQYKLSVDNQEFFVDLLLYNYILKRFIVIELKTTEFKPDFIGQIGFYITVVDNEIKTESDKPTIGLLICRSKNNTVVEYALQSTQKPTGVAEYKLADLPEDIASYLPSEDEIKNITSK
jgi:predicted nuclease of restriction endonuclease-like (RecB) superfamily